MLKQQKYHTKKVESDYAKTETTTLRFDKVTKDNLKELQISSGLSQSQIIRKLINNEHVIQKDCRMEVFMFRDKLNHLAKILTKPEDEQTLTNLEQEFTTLKSKFTGGN